MNMHTTLHKQKYLVAHVGKEVAKLGRPTKDLDAFVAFPSYRNLDVAKSLRASQGKGCGNRHGETHKCQSGSIHIINSL